VGCSLDYVQLDPLEIMHDCMEAVTLLSDDEVVVVEIKRLMDALR
jgi:hypothetical protein